eukprot:scaffold222_cov108-Skeletonema_marinoi.AAC.1
MALSLFGEMDHDQAETEDIILLKTCDVKMNDEKNDERIVVDGQARGVSYHCRGAKSDASLENGSSGVAVAI